MRAASDHAAATGRIDSVGNPRPVRVAFPVHVSFEGANFHVDNLTANLSVGGIRDGSVTEAIRDLKRVAGNRCLRQPVQDQAGRLLKSRTG